MKEYNLTKKIDNLLEEKIFRNLFHCIAIKIEYDDDIQFLNQGEWIKILQWQNAENKAKNKDALRISFKKGDTLCFFENLLEFCEWYVKEYEKKLDK